jgi:hypothetical protein
MCKLDNNFEGEFSGGKVTLIASTIDSFFDMCDNKLVIDKNVHCTFFVSGQEELWLESYLKKHQGVRLTVTSVVGRDLGSAL